MLFLSVKNKTGKILAACMAITMLMMPLPGCGKNNVEESTVATKASSKATVAATVTSVTETTAQKEPFESQKDAALKALTGRLYESRASLYVYKDYGVVENQFTQKAKMYGFNPKLAEDLNENWSEDAYSGTCIRCAQKTYEGDWNAWMWMTGYLPEGSTEPRLNDGSADGQGMDLTGAERLTFYARAEKGTTVKCEFFTLGFGRDAASGKKLVKYPDSSAKKSLGVVRLTDKWKKYSIPLKGLDLSYVVAGFGYSVNDVMNGNNANVVFYLDEIRFEGSIRTIMNAPVLLRSYDSENEIMKNCAYSYDNACAAMAFMAADKQAEAKQIVDAFVYAIRHDRALKAPIEGKIEGPVRVRNAYASGDISPMPGWGFAARIPGWYDYGKKQWLEDAMMCGTSSGNLAFVTLALLHYYQRYGGDEYLDTAKSLMEWVFKNCSDGQDGFTAGFDGWEEAKPPVVTKNTYRSLEHNIDLAACCRELYKITSDEKYQHAYDSCCRFIAKMYDPEQKCFLTGTKSDGVTPDRSNVVLDTQVWCAMALGKDFEPYKEALKTVEKMKTKEGGYPFCQENKNGGYWLEGTAFTALLYRELGDTEKYNEAMNALTAKQLESGLFPAATVDNLSTGIYLSDGSPWLYGKDPHVTPTAWMIMAATDGFNPYFVR